MDEEQGLGSPLAGGLRDIRRNVSSSIFGGRSAPNQVQGDNVSTNLISRNSLALSNVSIQLGGISDQVRNINSSLTTIKDNLAISDDIEKKKELAKRKREAILAEQGLREGKESDLEKKVQFALLSPVRRVAQVAKGILGRLGESLLILAGGWLTTQVLQFLKLNSEGNIEALKKFKDRFLKDLLIIGGIVLATTVGFGKIFTLVKGLGSLLSRITFSGFIVNSFKSLGAFILGNVGKFLRFIRSGLRGIGGIRGFNLGRLVLPGAFIFEDKIKKAVSNFFSNRKPFDPITKGKATGGTGILNKLLNKSLILLLLGLETFSGKAELEKAGLKPFQSFITSFSRAFAQFAMFNAFVNATAFGVGGAFAGVGALLGSVFPGIGTAAGAATGFGIGMKVGTALGVLGFFFPGTAKKLTGGFVDIEKFSQKTDKYATNVGMRASGVDKDKQEKVRNNIFNTNKNSEEENNSENSDTSISGVSLGGGEVVPFKTVNNGENLSLSDNTANIIDATTGNGKNGGTSVASGNSENSNEVPTINSSNNNDNQKIVAAAIMNLNLK